MVRLFLYISLLQIAVCAQVQSNLTIITGLVDSSVDMFQKDIPSQSKVFLNYQSMLGETFFLNRIQSKLSRIGAEFIFNQGNADLTLNYTIEDAGVKYDKVFKDGLLDDFEVERSVFLKGSYQLYAKSHMVKSNGFSYEAKDTIDYKIVKDVQHPSLAFTQADLPDEPFWNSLIEPAIAIGAIIVTIFLFFTVRSK